MYQLKILDSSKWEEHWYKTFDSLKELTNHIIERAYLPSEFEIFEFELKDKEEILKNSEYYSLLDNISEAKKIDNEIGEMIDLIDDILNPTQEQEEKLNSLCNAANKLYEERVSKL